MAESQVPSARNASKAELIAGGAALLYVFLWATAFVPSRILARGAPPLTILYLRFFLAGGVLLGLALAARLPFPRDRATWLRLAALGLCGNALYLGLNYEALRHMSAGMGSIIASMNPLLLALAAPFLLAEPLTPRKGIGLLLGFLGVVLAMHTRAGSQSARPIDVLMALGGVLAFVASNIVYKRMKSRPHALVLNGAQLFFAALILLPAGLVLEGPPHIVWTAPIVLSLAFLIIVLSVFASMLWFWILQHGEASRVSAWFFLTPVFGLLLGALLLGEKLAPMDGLALLVITAGLWLAARK